MKFAVAAAALLLSVCGGAYAGDRSYMKFDTPQVVEIVGSRIEWGVGGFTPDYFSTPDLTDFNYQGSRAEAVYQAKVNALKQSDVCANPAVSSSAKSTTSGSDTTTRWLTAQEVFNNIQMSKTWSMYQAAFGGSGLTVLINNTKYTGFRVTYADGSNETWIVNPGWATSTVKLFDTPAPGSITSATKGGCQS